MPVYEFVCEACGRPFEDLVRSYSAIPEVRCPHCGSASLRRKVSTFASRVSGSANMSTAGPGASCSVGGT
ncbi:MAG TPA: zinc ribbon domain-containing protein [bacterium]